MGIIKIWLKVKNVNLDSNLRASPINCLVLHSDFLVSPSTFISLNFFKLCNFLFPYLVHVLTTLTWLTLVKNKLVMFSARFYIKKDLRVSPEATLFHSFSKL